MKLVFWSAWILWYVRDDCFLARGYLLGTGSEPFSYRRSQRRTDCDRWMFSFTLGSRYIRFPAPVRSTTHIKPTGETLL